MRFLILGGLVFFNTSCVSDYFFAQPLPQASSLLTASPGPLAQGVGPSPSSTSSPTVVATNTPVITPSPIYTGNVSVRNLQPALAVRAMACLICHAQVNANIITDFGAGDDMVFMGGPVGTFRDFIYGDDPTKAFTPWFGNYVDTWQTATINGTVYVPEVVVPAATIASVTLPSAIPALKAGTSLAKFLTTPFFAPNNAVGVVSPSAVSYGVTPVSGMAPVVGVKTVIIRAPTDTEILSLVPQLSSKVSAFQEILTAAGPTLSGLSLVTSSAGVFTSNVASSGHLKCMGDVVISGPVYLKNLQLETNSAGCRLYVAGAVFIEGPVTFINYSGSNNLQITSSRAISMGIGQTQLHTRLVDDNRNLWIRGGAWWTSTANVLDQIAKILGDFNIINTSNKISDASDFVGSGYPTAPSAGNEPYSPPETRASINFNHLLLNAPIVESRYLGTFTGAIIAEAALFSVQKFVFYFDSNFTSPNVSVLPLITQSILVAQ